jgi:TPR repeat protein
MASNGTADDKLRSGYCIFTHCGRERDEDMVSNFLEASKQGSNEAAFAYAFCVLMGMGLQPNATKAVEFFRAAASKSHISKCMYEIKQRPFVVNQVFIRNQPVKHTSPDT